MRVWFAELKIRHEQFHLPLFARSAREARTATEAFLKRHKIEATIERVTSGISV